MADAKNINHEDHKRPELDQIAIDAGLTGAASYQSKPKVADAINRVRAGEDPAVVNSEYEQTEEAKAQPAPADSKDPHVAAAAEQRYEAEQQKNIYSLNGGHPRKFDSTGNPIFDSSQV